MTGKPLNEWFTIPGTRGAGGAAVQAYSGMALKESTSEIIIAAAGGHTDSSDNRVVSIDLRQDRPSWQTRMPASTSVQPDVAYYADGKPASRHTYWSTHYIALLDRVMLIGVEFAYGSGKTFPKVDGFNLGTNTWDPAGTWPDIGAGLYGLALDSNTGIVWTGNGSLAKWDPTTGKQSVVSSSYSGDMARTNCWDPVRTQLLSIGFGDGWGYGNYPTLNAYKISASGSRTPLAFNASAAYDSWTAEAARYAALEYDPDNNRLLFFSATSGAPGRIYVIAPNAGSNWDVSILPLGPGSLTPNASTGSWVMNRFRYVPALRGFVYLDPTPGADLCFIRTA